MNGQITFVIFNENRKINSELLKLYKIRLLNVCIFSLYYKVSFGNFCRMQYQNLKCTVSIYYFI